MVVIVTVQNGLTRLDRAADSDTAESADMQMSLSAGVDVTAPSAGDIESCVTVSAVTAAVDRQLTCRDSCLSNCDCATAS